VHAAAVAAVALLQGHHGSVFGQGITLSQLMDDMENGYDRMSDMHQAPVSTKWGFRRPRQGDDSPTDAEEPNIVKLLSKAVHAVTANNAVCSAINLLCCMVGSVSKVMPGETAVQVRTLHELGGRASGLYHSRAAVAYLVVSRCVLHVAGIECASLLLYTLSKQCCSQIYCLNVYC
jgi:hypothetical protein